MRTDQGLHLTAHTAKAAVLASGDKTPEAPVRVPNQISTQIIQAQPTTNNDSNNSNTNNNNNNNNLRAPTLKTIRSGRSRKPTANQPEETQQQQRTRRSATNPTALVSEN